MPWQEMLRMDQRVQFIADYQRNEVDVAELARRFRRAAMVHIGVDMFGERHAALAQPRGGRRFADTDRIFRHDEPGKVGSELVNRTCGLSD